MIRPRGWGLATFVLLLLVGAVASAQTTPPFGRITKPKFKTFVSPIGNFEVEYPSGRDWTVLSGRGDAVLMIAENRTGAALIVIERQPLRGAFGPADMPDLAKAEIDKVLERERGAIDVRQQVLEIDKRQVVTVSFLRPGIKGQERFVQYTIPIGETLYRVTCSVVEKELPRYAPIFGHIAASLQIPPPAKK